MIYTANARFENTPLHTAFAQRELKDLSQTKPSNLIYAAKPHYPQIAFDG
jgi:hypothetical protein